MCRQLNASSSAATAGRRGPAVCRVGGRREAPKGFRLAADALRVVKVRRKSDSALIQRRRDFGLLYGRTHGSETLTADGWLAIHVSLSHTLTCSARLCYMFCVEFFNQFILCDASRMQSLETKTPGALEREKRWSSRVLSPKGSPEEGRHGRLNPGRFIPCRRCGASGRTCAVGQCCQRRGPVWVIREIREAVRFDMSVCV